jgi:hypothetical protein
VECSLGPRVASIKAVDEAGNGRAGSAELLSESSESDGKLYHIFSSSSVYLLERSSSDESGGEESSNWLSNKSEKSNKPPKVAIIIAKVKQKVLSVFLIN